MNDPWWRRRKKKSRWFSDIYDELDKLGEMIDETMHKAFEDGSKNSSVRPNRVQGFSMKIGPDGRPGKREINGSQPVQAEPELSDDLEPLVDLIEEGNQIIVLVSLPGVGKENIDLRVTENCLIVSIDTDEFEWYDEFKLPTKVKTKSARASYKNGVLKVRLEKFEKIVKDNGIFMKK